MLQKCVCVMYTHTHNLVNLNAGKAKRLHTVKYFSTSKIHRLLYLAYLIVISPWRYGELHGGHKGRQLQPSDVQFSVWQTI